ncbi:MAG: 2-oxoacid:acceptor oxidoreductase family protein [Pirellulales bacterium]|nr:2-oxoacid:acceptor oxidoreductase family protein [Pirellulales bacterium]
MVRDNESSLLLSGNEAVALAAKHGNLSLGSGYPGTPSTEILEYLDEIGGNAQWAPNEKVGLEVALGAAFAGGWAMATMKHVGLNVAADVLFTAAYSGVSGALLIVSADDPGMASSQNEQDNRRYAVAAAVPMFEPSDSQEAYDFTRAALELSARWKLPVMLRMTTRICHSKTLVRPRPAPSARPDPHFERNIQGRVMIPAHARPAHRKLRQKLAEIAAWNETCPYNKIIEGDKKLGIITAGVCFAHAREAAPDASILKLGVTYPLPLEKIRDFAAGVERCLVVEENDPYLFEQLRAADIEVEQKPEMYRFGEFDVGRVRRILSGDTSEEPAPPRGKPPALCVGCPHRHTFELLKKLDCIVSGDIGCYTLGALPPLEAMDSQICMGASLGVGLGMRHVLPENEARRVVSVIGDSTFIHGGITGLVEMVYNPPKTGHVLLILDNGTTAMTGLQEHPGTGRTLGHQPTGKLVFEDLARAVGVKNVHVFDPSTEAEQFERTLREALASNELSVFIARRPCILAAGKIKQREKEQQEGGRGEGRGEREERVKEVAEQHGLKYVNLKETVIPKSILEIVPPQVAREATIIPFSEHDGILTIVVDDPTDYDKLDKVRFHLNRQIEIALAPRSAIKEAIDQYYGRTCNERTSATSPTAGPLPSPLSSLPSPTSVVIAGLGGQGVLKASDILADAAFLAGYDVKKSEIHGMSQRGGSVASDVRFGGHIDSPMIPAGEADVLVVLADDQVENNRPRLREGGVLIAPDCIDADALPNRRSGNVAILGALSKHLEIEPEVWKEAIRRNLKPKLHEDNFRAFEIGRDAIA